LTVCRLGDFLIVDLKRAFRAQLVSENIPFLVPANSPTFPLTVARILSSHTLHAFRFSPVAYPGILFAGVQ